MRHIGIWGFALLMLLFASPRASVTAQNSTAMADSPSKILFESTDIPDLITFYTENPDGTELKRIAQFKPEDVGILDFRWSWNGQYIAFTSTNKHSFGSAPMLNVMNADGSDIHQFSQLINGQFAWSPDSKQIAVVVLKDDDSEIHLIRRDGSGEKAIALTDPEAKLAWSPDSKQIAFTAMEQLYVINVDGTGGMALSPNGDEVTTFAWSPDSKLVAFVTTENEQAGIYTVRPDASNTQKLIDLPSTVASLEWSPDGQYLSYAQRNEMGYDQIPLFIVGADRKNNHQVATINRGYSWSPDSKHVIYMVTDAGGFAKMFIVDLNGQNQTPLPGNGIGDQKPSWSPIINAQPK